MGLILDPNRVIAKEIKLILLCDDIISIGRGNALAPTGAIYYHAQLGLPYKGRTIKGLVVCYVVCVGSMKGGWFLRHAQGASVS